ncbi:MAG: Sll0314/Alr1548 family TPR repeat-containing protein [Stanieria sp.]
MKKSHRLIGCKKASLATALLIGISYFGVISPALAADPFRTENARDIGEHTEAAFKIIFLQGNYKTVVQELTLAESQEANEPLVYAMQASLAYTEEDWETLKKYALKTLEKAQALQNVDPVRGNLYLAVGHFLDGAYIYEKEGPVGAINKLQLVFKFLDAAEAKDPNDPELNLIKGYMDLLLAVNLPFSSPEQAISRFEKFAAPNYLVDRGLAVAYRDLKKYDRALKFVNQALSIAPDNPELFYLKGQILRKIGKNKEDISILQDAWNHFNHANSKSAQLPKFVTESLGREMRQTQEQIAEIQGNTANKTKN